MPAYIKRSLTQLKTAVSLMAISKLRHSALEAEQHPLSNAVGPPVHRQTPGAECLPGVQSQGFGHRAARAACRARNGVLFLCDQTRNNVE